MKLKDFIIKICSYIKNSDINLEPETILEDMKMNVNEKNKNLVYAIQSCYNGFVDDYHIAEKISLAFSKKVVNFNEIQQPTIEDVYLFLVAYKIVKRVKEGLTEIEINDIIKEKDVSLGEEVIKYISSISVNENVFVSWYKPVQKNIIDFLVANFPTLIYKAKKIGENIDKETNPFKNETIEYFQFEKVKEIKNKVIEEVGKNEW